MRIDLERYAARLEQAQRDCKDHADPVMKLPTAEHFGLTEDNEKRLSEIIDEINSRTGKNYDNDLVVRAMLQIPAPPLCSSPFGLGNAARSDTLPVEVSMTPLIDSTRPVWS